MTDSVSTMDTNGTLQSHLGGTIPAIWRLARFDFDRRIELHGIVLHRKEVIHVDEWILVTFMISLILGCMDTKDI